MKELNMSVKATEYCRGYIFRKDSGDLINTGDIPCSLMSKLFGDVYTESETVIKKIWRCALND